MVRRADVAGLVIAGGFGTRMGAEKPLIAFRHGTLLDAVIARANSQTGALAVNVRSGRMPVYRARYPALHFIADAPGHVQGPLAGLLAGLSWIHAEGRYRWLATFPCDTPFLPTDLVARLAASREGQRPCVAMADGRIQNLCAVWPVTALLPVRRAIAGKGICSVRQALDLTGATHCAFDGARDAFLNINTRADLAFAKRLANL